MATSAPDTTAFPSRSLLWAQALGAVGAAGLAGLDDPAAGFACLLLTAYLPAWRRGRRTAAAWLGLGLTACGLASLAAAGWWAWQIGALAVASLAHAAGHLLVRFWPAGDTPPPRSPQAITTAWLTRSWFALLLVRHPLGWSVAGLWTLLWLLVAAERLRDLRVTAEPWPFLELTALRPSWGRRLLWCLLGGLPAGPPWLDAVLRNARQEPFGRRLEALYGVLRRSRSNLDPAGEMLLLMLCLWTGRAGYVLVQAPRLRQRWRDAGIATEPRLDRQLWLLEALAAVERGQVDHAATVVQAFQWLAPPSRNDQILLTLAAAGLDLQQGSAATAAERLKNLPLRCEGPLVQEAWARYARLLRARAMLALGDAATAVRLARDDATQQPWSAEAAWISGRARLALRDREGAGSAFHEARRLATGNPWARRALRELTALATLNASDSPPDSAGSPAPSTP